MLFCRSVLPVALIFTGSLAVLPGTATAASCNGDRKLDVPMQFRATVLSAGRVHVTAFGGSDKSGWVIPVDYRGWRLYDATGREVDYFTRADLGFASKDMLKETNIDGLVPGASYTIELMSQDYCNNKGTFRQSVTMPAAAPESNSPVVSTPNIIQVGFMSANPALRFSATDDTGLARVAIYIDGVLAKEYRYANGVGFRWWCDVYPVDGVQSTLEGPNFYWPYPTQYRYRAALVDIVVEDLLGNHTTTSAQLYL
jgi:hypothetical protein